MNIYSHMDDRYLGGNYYYYKYKWYIIINNQLESKK